MFEIDKPEATIILIKKDYDSWLAYSNANVVRIVEEVDTLRVTYTRR